MGTTRYGPSHKARDVVEYSSRNEPVESIFIPTEIAGIESGEQRQRQQSKWRREDC